MVQADGVTGAEFAGNALRGSADGEADAAGLGDPLREQDLSAATAGASGCDA